MISKGKEYIDYAAAQNISDVQLAYFYLGIKSLPILMNNPLRDDNNPSLGLFCPNNINVFYRDFGTNEHGHITQLLEKLWHCDRKEVYARIYKDFIKPTPSSYNTYKSNHNPKVSLKNNLTLNCQTREWKDYDLEYWNSYGISLEWLKYADIYPIDYKIITINEQSFAYKADKYAYAYAEFKEDKPTLKIYQPFNKSGYKWSSTHDHSVISLWTKIPQHGNSICICSSMKDALCLWSNVGIPAIAIQGEGYPLSKTVIKQLKERFKYIFICLDNDETGIKDAKKLSESTGFINVVLPKFEGGKDISDMYKVLNNKNLFKETLLKLFKNEQRRNVQPNQE